jgi:hypothetical protein
MSKEAGVQIGFVDFGDSGIAAQKVFLKNFTHGGSQMLKECWLVGDEFVIVTGEGKQIIVNKSCAIVWNTLLPVDWLVGEQLLPPKEQEQLCKAREVAAREKAGREEKKAKKTAA